MKKFAPLFFALICALTAGIAVRAQEPLMQQPNPMRRQPSPQDSEPPEKRPNLLRELNLTPEQIQQIKVINRETRETVQKANQRQRQARRALDMTIYGDNATGAEVEQRTRELNDAQAEVNKLRSSVEFRIRQLLTPEQLAQFRQLRQRLGQKMLERQQQRPPRRQNNKPL